MELKTGLKFENTIICDETNIASKLHSGALDVFSTPSLLTLCEASCAEAVLPYLEEGCSTVGTEVKLSHLASTPVGMKITLKGELVEIDRRRLKFELSVYDEKELIGRCTHERFIVNNERFLEKTYSKLQNA